MTNNVDVNVAENIMMMLVVLLWIVMIMIIDGILKEKY